MAKTIFEEMGGKYERQGDYLIPCLTVPAEEEQPIGIWGQRHLDYLKHHCKVTCKVGGSALRVTAVTAVTVILGYPAAVIPTGEHPANAKCRRGIHPPFSGV